MKNGAGDSSFEIRNSKFFIRLYKDRMLSAVDSRPVSAQFTCPMHPEILRDAPGFCPICGMALEPRVAALDDQPNPELIDMRRRFVVCAILTAPIIFLGMRQPLIQL